MKRGKTKLSLQDHKSMKDLLIELYGNKEVKDGSTKKSENTQEISGSQRSSGTTVVSEMDKVQLQAEKVCRQDEQRGQAHANTRSPFEVDGFKGRC